MKDVLNINKEISLLKQTNPVIATALEKIVKCFSNGIQDLESTHGTRIQHTVLRADQAFDKVKALEKQVKKIKDFADKADEVEKFLKHLQKRSNDFKARELKVNQIGQKVIALNMKTKELENIIQDFAILTGILKNWSKQAEGLSSD